MGIGEIILACKGKQDDYLIRNPQITQFKKVFRRYTNFSKKTIKIYNSNYYKWGGEFVFNIPTKLGGNSFIYSTDIGNKYASDVPFADLLHDIALEIPLPRLTVTSGYNSLKWTDKIGLAFVKEISLYFNGTLIDRHTSEYLEIISEFSHTKGKQDLYNYLIGDNIFSKFEVEGPIKEQLIYIPLRFWFCENVGLSLPLSAMHGTNIQIRVKTRKLEELYQHSNPDTVISASSVPQNSNLVCNVFYLDKEEKRIFADMPHKYLITQIKEETNDILGNINQYEFLFTNPIREIFWYGRRKDNLNSNFKLLDGKIDFNNYFNYLSHPSKTIQKNMFYEFSIFVKDNLYIQDGPQFFNYVIPNKYYKRTPKTGLFAYNFCEKPYVYQPSGIFNLPTLEKVGNDLKFTNVNKFNLGIKLNGLGEGEKTINMIAITYNVLSINGEYKPKYDYKNNINSYELVGQGQAKLLYS